MTTLDWKKCKKCGEFFDIGTNLDVCVICRLKKLNEMKKDVKKIK